MIKNRRDFSLLEKLLGQAKEIFINTVRANFEDVTSLLVAIVYGKNNIQSIGSKNGNLYIDTTF